MIRDDLLAFNPYARELRQLGLELANAVHNEQDAVLGRRPREEPVAVRLTATTNSREVAAVIVRNGDDPTTTSSITSLQFAIATFILTTRHLFDGVSDVDACCIMQPDLSISKLKP